MITGDPIGGIMGLSFAILIAVIAAFVLYYEPKKPTHRKRR